MFRRIIIYFLIFTTFSANLARIFIVAEFEMNKTYIATNLCINRDKPQLHCNGKCYLMAKLKQAEENEKKQSTKNKLNAYSGFMNGQKVTIQPKVSNYTPTKPSPLYVSFYISNNCETIFRPPRALA